MTAEELKEIEIANDIHGKEFKVTIWRNSTQKSTQENKNSTQENAGSTQISTQKSKSGTQIRESSTPKQILNILREHPQTSRKELSKIIGITEDGIKKQLAKLKKEGMIERIGADNGGYWKVK